MSSLYELTDKYRQIQAVLEDGNEEYPIETLTVGEDLDQKIENYGFIIRNFESEDAMLDAEIKRLQERQKNARRAVERLKDSLFNSLKATNRKKVTTSHFTFSIASAGGEKPLIIDGDVPEAYCKIKLEPDKEAIRAAIEEDGEVLDFAHIGERSEYLKMR